MSRYIINVGTNPNDGTGDTIRGAFQNVNNNFAEIYTNVAVSFNTANAAFNQANSAMGQGTQASQAYSTANSAYNTANTRLANVSSGISYAGSLFFPATANVGIGTTSPQAYLTILGSGTGSNQTSLAGAVLDAQAWSPTTTQLHVRNSNNGVGGSSDFVATADNGSDSSNYVNLGINGSGYNQPGWTINGPDDAYLYASDGNLSIGVANTSATYKYINFFVGGTSGVGEVMRIQDSAVTVANVGILTVNPQASLDVNGTINVSSSATVGGSAYISGNLSVGGPTLTVAGQNVISFIGTVFSYANSVNANVVSGYSYANGVNANVVASFTTANAAYGAANNMVYKGYFRSTIYGAAIPGGYPSLDYQGTDTFVGQSPSVDAFGVSLIDIIDFMDPVGSLKTQDFGSNVAI